MADDDVHEEDVLDLPGVDDLYAVEPGEFVTMRDALVKGMRGDGQREAAAAVAKLRRPTVVAWALNRVARTAPREIEALLDAGAAVRTAQSGALAHGDADALREAMRERRRLVTALAATAAELAGGAHRDAVAATLEAATLDDEAGALLRAGRLTKELAPELDFGFGGTDDGPARDGAAPEATPAGGALGDEQGSDKNPVVPRDDLAVRRREVERRRDIERAETAVARSEERLGRAEERLADAQRAVEDARAAVEDARAARDRLAGDAR